MLNIFRKKPSVEEAPATQAPSWLTRLNQSLGKTRHKLSEQLGNLFLGKKALDPAFMEELETLLISADLGVQTSQNMIKKLTQRIERKQLNDSDALFTALKQELTDILTPREQSISEIFSRPQVILMVGINGAGKTTSIGKLAHRFQQDGKKVMLAAGDTFRAAAVEQLQRWGERNNVPVIAQNTGADSASVLYDAVQAAKAREMDVLLADTAGRLHNKDHLMEELKKIKRVIAKADPQAPHEVMLVLDASIGQNAINQVKEFHEAIGVTALIITKLDGTAKGGVIFAIAEQFGIPIAYIGVGEGMEDLQPFNAQAFVDALFN